MSSMLDMLSGNEVEIGIPSDNFVGSAENENFANNLKRWRTKIVNDYVRYGTDINKAIATVAEQNNLNNDQILRVIEEVNTQVYLIEYNKMKGNMSKDIEFNIGSLQKVKDLLSNNSKANTEAQENPENKDEEPKMKKKASLTSEGDSLNFLNYTAYDTFGLAEDKKISKRALLERELSEKLAEVQEDFDRTLSEFTSDTYCLAESLVKYASLNKDHQMIFEKVSKEAGLTKNTQIIIKKAYTQKVEQLKEYKSLPESFPNELELVDGLTKEAKLSLGKFSLIKEAGEDSSNKELPTVVTDKKTIKNYKSLVELATKIQKQQDDLLAKQQKKNNIENMLQK